MKKAIVLIMVFLWICSVLRIQGQDSKLDSLWNVYNNSEQDTTRIQILLDLGKIYKHQMSDSSLECFNKALILVDLELKAITDDRLMKGNYKSILLGMKANTLQEIGIGNYLKGNYSIMIRNISNSLIIFEQLENNYGIAQANNNLGVVYLEINSYENAKKCFLASIKYSELIGNKKILAAANSSLGVMYKDLGNIDSSLIQYMKALQVYEELEDNNGIASQYNNIGLVYLDQANYETALQYLTKSQKLSEDNGYINILPTCYNNMGVAYKYLGEIDEAIKYYSKLGNLAKEIGDNSMLASYYTNVGILYLNQGKYIKAKEYFIESIKLDQSSGRIDDVVHNYISLAALHNTLADSLNSINRYQVNNHLDTALFYAKKAFESSKTTTVLMSRSKSSEMLQKIFSKLGNYQEALKYAEIFIETNDSLFSRDKTDAITEITTKYETEKKEQQIALQEVELEKKDIEVKQKKTQRNAFVGGFSLVLVLAAVILIGYTQKRKANTLLTSQKIEIEDKNVKLEIANVEIAEKNKNITDSIQYAKRIQEAILPPDKIIKQYMEESFILYKPRDIVSGDFYWMEVVKEKVLFAAVDCTGHGVPGAFVSIVGHNGLNRAVKELGITEPAKILDKLNDMVHETFSSTEDHDVKDGMDITLCCLNTNNNTLEYAGAHNPLFLIRNKELQIFKADKQPIGKFAQRKPFTNNTIALQQNDAVYIFSDGYTDQFGGPDDKRFTLKRFRELLLEINNQPMQEQKKLMAAKFDQWKNNTDQIDDVLVMGVKIT